MSLSRCSDNAVLSFNTFHLRVLCQGFLLLLFLSSGCVFKPSVVYFNFTVCPSVPETLNLWGQSRSQVRSSGTGLHSVSTSHKKEHFIQILIRHSLKSSVLIWCLLKHKKTLGWYNVCLSILLYVSAVCWLFQYVYLSSHDWNLSNWTRRRRSLVLRQRHSQGANPIGWLCVIALSGGQ